MLAGLGDGGRQGIPQVGAGESGVCGAGRTNPAGGQEGSLARCFPAVDELLAGFRTLAEQYRGRAKWFRIGYSRQGEPLWALRVGDGSQRILAYGFPQPDEPLGGAALLELARLILDDGAMFGQATWTLVPCIDPDGARRNEGWFAAPLALETYARRHFRPPEGEQVEWTFPYRDPAWPWDRPLPETLALQALLDETRPDLLFPLHNSLVGGAYAFVSAGAQALAPRLPPCWNRHGVPTHHGEPELPFATLLAPGVYQLPDLAEIADALAAQGIADPAGLLQCGAPAYLVARDRGTALAVTPEIPLFTLRDIGDPRPADRTRRQVLGKSLVGDRDALAHWMALYEEARPLLGSENPFWGALDSYRRSAPALLEAAACWLESDATLERPATVGEVADCEVIAPYLRLLSLGMLDQALQWASDHGAGPSCGVIDEVSDCLDRGLARVRALLQVDAVPVETLVRVVTEIVRLAAEVLLQ